jgi:hypothetical protein
VVRCRKSPVPGDPRRPAKSGPRPRCRSPSEVRGIRARPLQVLPDFGAHDAEESVPSAHNKIAAAPGAPPPAQRPAIDHTRETEFAIRAHESSLAADKLRGISQIAAFIGEHPATTYRWAQFGWLDCWKIGSLWVSTKSRLTKQFNEQKFVPPAPAEAPPAARATTANTGRNLTAGPGPEPPPAAPLPRRRPAADNERAPVPGRRAQQHQRRARTAQTASRSTRRA